MTRSARKQAESGLYHVMARGVDHCVLFKDRADGLRFLGTFEKYLGQFDVRVDAWCLMGNHYHLLLRGDLPGIADMMKCLNMSYALYFNERNGRVGHLFQGRFKSLPVETDEYYLTVLRYIHQNPEKAGICRIDEYPWSSYRSYIRGKGIAYTTFALTLLGGVDAFVEFHRRGGCKTLSPETDDECRSLSISLLGGIDPGEIKQLGREEKNRALRIMKSGHLSTRQIERLTGISRSVVSRVR